MQWKHPSFSKLSQIQGAGISWPDNVLWTVCSEILKVNCWLTICLTNWQLQESTMLTDFANCLSQLKRSAEESWLRYHTFARQYTASILTGQMLDKPLYLNVDLKKCAIHAYSADQTPNDYHLLLNLKKHLRGQRFLTDDELKFAAKEWLKGQSGLLYFPGIENSEFAMNCTLTKAVIISKNKCMLIRPSFV